MSILFDGEDNEREHPSFGLLGFHRVSSSGGVNLFGSMIQHKETIRLTLKEASVERGLSHNWYHGGKTLYEIEMSMSQFGELISSLNYGDGVPVTIRKRQDVPGFIKECPFEDETDLHRQEFAELLKSNNETVNLISNRLDELMEKKSLTKADREEIRSLLRKLKQDVGVNTEYRAKVFDEYADNVISEAKGEIEAFWDMRVRKVGEEAIGKALLKDAENPVSLEEIKTKSSSES